MMYWTLAVKNTLRNPLRTAITLSAVSFGGAALIVCGGMMADGLGQLRDNLIATSLGHLQIARKGYFEKGSARPFDFMIEDPDAVASVAAGQPGVKSAAPRLRFFGLLSSEDTSLAFVGEGVDPAREKAGSSGLQIVAGSSLEGSSPYQAVLGQGLARALQAEPGSSLVIVSNAKEGAINAFDVNVDGLYSTGVKDIDDASLRVPLSAAQKLLHTRGAHTVVVVLDKTEDTAAVKARLEAEFKKRGWDLEIKPWYELADFYLKTESFFKREFAIVLIIIAVVVFLGVFNTLNMAVLERVGEIGTMMALGYRRQDVERVFVAEGLVLGLFGGTLGVAGGFALAKLLSWIGIPMPPAPGHTEAIVSRVALVPGLFVLSFLLSALAALISSIQPARRASGLEIAEALRQNI